MYQILIIEKSLWYVAITIETLYHNEISKASYSVTYSIWSSIWSSINKLLNDWTGTLDCRLEDNFLNTIVKTYYLLISRCLSKEKMSVCFQSSYKDFLSCQKNTEGSKLSSMIILSFHSEINKFWVIWHFPFWYRYMFEKVILVEIVLNSPLRFWLTITSTRGRLTNWSLGNDFLKHFLKQTNQNFA